MTDISSLITTEVEKWTDSLVEPPVNEARDINNGHCKAFAQDIDRKHPRATIIRKYGYETPEYTSFAHAWIELNGRHYDSESPNGVDHPRNLPLFQRADIDPTDDPL